MRRALVSCVTLLFAANPVLAQEAEADETLATGPTPAEEVAPEERLAASPAGAEGAQGAQRSGLGMSILGNQEAPTSLVIVPWKSSQIGEGIGVARALDTTIRPVDKDVFLRELRYYRIRASETE